MSDVFEGPGYWMASDGKWYPPERHPDPSYRARFELAPQVPPPVPQSAAAQAAAPATDTPTTASVQEPAAAAASAPGDGVDGSIDLSESAQDNAHLLEEPAMAQAPGVAEAEHSTSAVPGPSAADDAAPEFPTVGLRAESPAVDPERSPGAALSDIHHVHDNHDVRTGGPATADKPETTPPFSVGSNTFAKATDRPVFDVPSPRSVVGGATKPSSTVSGSNVELELGQPDPAAPRMATRPAAAANLSTSTALAVIPGPPDLPPISILDRLLAAAIFCAGVAMIVGTFLDWTTGSVVQTGWERGDGIATIIAGVIGSATAGPIYVGYHHIVPKAVAVVSGLVGLVVIGLAAMETLTDSAAADTSIGVGFIVVLAGSAVMALAGLAHRVDLRY